jgi:iron(III) transport system permease protein
MSAAGSTAVSGSSRSRDRAPRVPGGLLLICGLVAIVVLVPVVVTVVQALQGGLSAAETFIRARSSLSLLLHTLEVAVIATPITGVLGVGGAWFVERTSLPCRSIFALLLVAPLTVPLFVTSYAWATLGTPIPGLAGAVGIVAFSYYPIVYLLVAASLRVTDPAMEETARSLGLGPWQTFRRVVLPQIRPALLGGLLLVALDVLVEFDAFVALKFQTFSTNIYAQYQLSFSPSGAAALSLFSIVLCVIVLFVERRLRGGANYTRISQGVRRGVVRYELGRRTPLVIAALAVVIAISLGIPLVRLASWFTQGSSAAVAGAAAGVQYVWPATRTSVLLGVSAAIIAVLLALPVAVMAVRHRGRVVTLLERSTYLSFALPDIVAAIALAYASSHVVHFLYGTMILLILAEAVLFVPFAVVALRSTFGLIEPALEESARSLGLGPLATLRRVTLPLARPGLAAAGVLVFALVLGDLATAQILLPPGLYTLGTQFWADSQSVAFAAAAPYAAVLVGLSMVATYVLMSRFGKVRTLGDG